MLPAEAELRKSLACWIVYLVIFAASCMTLVLLRVATGLKFPFNVMYLACLCFHVIFFVHYVLYTWPFVRKMPSSILEWFRSIRSTAPAESDDFME